MNTSTKTTKISAVFLATVLLAGLIASIPSIMPNAQAAPYGMDNNKYPSHGKDKFGKDVSVKFVKCNNINVNVNGLELDINDLPNGFLGDDAADTQASGLGNGMSGGSNGPSKGFDNDGFVFVCINNNNNAGSGGDDDDDDDRTCEECFREELGLQLQLLLTVLGSTAGLVVDFEAVDSPTEPFRSIEDICDFLELVGTATNINSLLTDIVDAVPGLDLTTGEFEGLLNCIEIALGLNNGPTV
jgi:hypothetical protein